MIIRGLNQALKMYQLSIFSEQPKKIFLLHWKEKLPCTLAMYTCKRWKNIPLMPAAMGWHLGTQSAQNCIFFREDFIKKGTMCYSKVEKDNIISISVMNSAETCMLLLLIIFLTAIYKESCVS